MKVFSMRMIWLAGVMLAALVSGWAADVSGPVLRSTTYTRGLLTNSTAASARSYLGVAEAGSSTNLSLSGGTYTTDVSILDTSGIWNDAGDTFTGWKLNITNTASAAASLLLDLRVGDVSELSVRRDGLLSVSSQIIATDRVIGGSFAALGGTISVHGLRLAGNTEIAWGSNTATWNSTSDLILARDAAGVLAQRNGANAQAFRVYNTYTDSSNHERGFIRWNSNTLEIGNEVAGSGTARPFALTLNGTTRLAIATTGTATYTGALGVSSDITVGGSVRLKNSSGELHIKNLGDTASIALLAGRSVNAKTTDYIVTDDEAGRIFSNAGAGGQVVYTLPAGASGLTYTWCVTDAQNVRIAANGAEQIRVAAAISTATTGNVESNTVGNSITLVWLGSFWAATSVVGTWTVN